MNRGTGKADKNISGTNICRGHRDAGDIDVIQGIRKRDATFREERRECSGARMLRS
jgi:hypothetical protein